MYLSSRWMVASSNHEANTKRAIPQISGLRRWRHTREIASNGTIHLSSMPRPTASVPCSKRGSGGLSRPWPGQGPEEPRPLKLEEYRPTLRGEFTFLQLAIQKKPTGDERRLGRSTA